MLLETSVFEKGTTTKYLLAIYSFPQGLQAPEVRIKWPNDLYAEGLKIGGVLCTSTYSSKKFNIVIGKD